jgi:hypothetical protein
MQELCREEHLRRLTKLQEKDHYSTGEKGELPLAQRLDLDLPIFAIALIAIGFFLCLNYSAF